MEHAAQAAVGLHLHAHGNSPRWLVAAESPLAEGETGVGWNSQKHGIHGFQCSRVNAWKQLLGWKFTNIRFPGNLSSFWGLPNKNQSWLLYICSYGRPSEKCASLNFSSVMSTPFFQSSQDQNMHALRVTAPWQIGVGQKSRAPMNIPETSEIDYVGRVFSSPPKKKYPWFLRLLKPIPPSSSNHRPSSTSSSVSSISHQGSSALPTVTFTIGPRQKFDANHQNGRVDRCRGLLVGGSSRHGFCRVWVGSGKSWWVARWTPGSKIFFPFAINLARPTSHLAE